MAGSTNCEFDMQSEGTFSCAVTTSDEEMGENIAPSASVGDVGGRLFRAPSLEVMEQDVEYLRDVFRKQNQINNDTIKDLQGRLKELKMVEQSGGTLELELKEQLYQDVLLEWETDSRKLYATHCKLQSDRQRLVNDSCIANVLREHCANIRSQLEHQNEQLDSAIHVSS